MRRAKQSVVTLFCAINTTGANAKTRTLSVDKHRQTVPQIPIQSGTAIQFERVSSPIRSTIPYTDAQSHHTYRIRPLFPVLISRLGMRNPIKKPVSDAEPYSHRSDLTSTQTQSIGMDGVSLFGILHKFVPRVFWQRIFSGFFKNRQ